MPHCNKQMASFFMTTKCNLRCIYCYNSRERRQMKEQSISLEMAKAGVDYFYSTNKSRHIRFYGPGEPTQEFNKLKAIVEYAKKRDEKTTTEIQTNGCFSKVVREWLLNNMNIIWVSFDGEPDIQDHNRPCANGKASSPIIEKNVRWLLKNRTTQNIMVGARVTITGENVLKQKQIIDYFISLGIDYIWCDPLFPSVDKIPVCNDKDKLNAYSFDMNQYVDNYIEAYYYAKGKNVFYGSFLTCNFDGVCNKHCRACTPVPHFTTDGYVSACDLVTFGANAGHMDCFVYGKWNEETKEFEIDNEKVKVLQSRITDNMQHCKNCIAKEHCGGYCLGEVMNETGNLFGQKNKTCKAIKKLYKALGPTNDLYKYMHP